MPAASPQISRRFFSLLFGLAALGLLLVAVVLTPSDAGHGTHTGRGLPSCGWVIAFDTPCPTCGMTTSFAHAVRGDLPSAFLTQPMGSLLALVTAAMVVGGLHGAITGRRLDRLADALLSTRTLWVTFALVAAAWVYKILTWTA